jgi:hypothetical protein
MARNRTRATETEHAAWGQFDHVCVRAARFGGAKAGTRNTNVIETREMDR